MTPEQTLDAWVDAHFDEEVKYLQALVQVPTDTPPGNNAPHAERAAELLAGFGFTAEKHAVPAELVKAAGLQTVTNLVVRRPYGAGPTIALNAHGDVVPPGEGWTHPPYGGEVHDGKLYGRAAAVSKCDFATFTFAVRALESLGEKLAGGVELHFTYDEEFGGEVGPDWLLRKRPDEARPADRRRLQLPGRHRAQRLPAARGHGARQDGPRRDTRHRHRRAAGRDRRS